MQTLKFSAVLMLVTACCSACGGPSDRPSPAEVESSHAISPRPDSDAPEGDDVAAGACDSDSSRDCRVWLRQVNNTRNCFVGTQLCLDGAWSDCLTDEAATALLGE